MEIIRQMLVRTGNDLKTWRKENEISQEHLALAFSCTRQRIMALERKEADSLPLEWQLAITALKFFPDLWPIIH